MSTRPTLGDPYPNERRCIRVREWGLCHEPGAWHIIWSGPDASPACAECAEYARRKYDYEDMHPLGPDCGMVASMYFEDEQTCRMPRSTEDIQKGRIVF